MDKIGNMERVMDQLKLLAATYGVRVIGAIALLIFAWVFSGWVGRAIDRGLTKVEIR